MTDDNRLTDADPFEGELRRTLDALAGEPAPEHLLARVAQIPSEEPVMQSFRSRLSRSTSNLGAGWLALAGALVIALAVLVVRPVGPAPTGPGSSAIAAVPTTAAQSNAIPSSGASSSTVPSPVVPSASPAAASPAPSPAQASAPVGFEPVSVTFVSADQGWVLGRVPCGSSRCAGIERTTDGGRTWASIPAPTTTVTDIGLGSGASAGIGRLRFATPNDGWAYGPDLWATHDGGATWTRLAAPSLPSGSPIVALESANGSVHAVFYDGGQQFRIATSPIGRDAWQMSPLKLAIGAGPVPEVQLVLSGATGWLLENDRTVVGGLRLVAGGWRTWNPACADVTGPAAIAASSSTTVVASCDVGQWSSPAGNHLFVSRDGGASFAETGSPVPVTLGGGVATPDTSTIVIAGTDAGGSVLVGSFDGGHSWSVVLRAGMAGFADLGFTTTTQGVVVTNSANGLSRLLITRDGGHTWSTVAF